LACRVDPDLIGLDVRRRTRKEETTMSQAELPSDDVAGPEPQGCLAALLQLFGIRVQPAEVARADDTLPYRLTQGFLSAAELSFYKVLVQILPTDTVVADKPRLGDILFVP